MIPSPKVATYDKDPKMSVHGVAQKVAEVLLKGEHEFVMCNFAPPDMVCDPQFYVCLVLMLLNTYKVGHTGIYDAAVTAITETDKAVGTIYKAAQEAGYILLITADHGNAEQMRNKETGAPHTAHTTNPVPLIMTGDPAKYMFVMDGDKMAAEKEGKGVQGTDEEEEGALCDVAPTVLDLMVSHFSCCITRTFLCQR